MFKKITQTDIFGYSWKKRLEVTGITLLVSIGALLLGTVLDKTFNVSKPIFAASLFILSYPVCQFFLYRKYGKMKTSPSTMENDKKTDNEHD